MGFLFCFLKSVIQNNNKIKTENLSLKSNI